MTSSANRSQFEAWNGDSGHRWVAGADRRDRVLGPVADALLAEAAPATGERVLDLGCGCGATTLMAAARVGATGRATGIDLSAPMLGVARRRAEAAGATNATFVQADAQTRPFEPGGIDLVISRFGTMFFSDAMAAFVNVARAMRPGGRIALATWQPLVANEWLTVPGAALLAHTELPPMSADEPGMFAQADPAVITSTLGRAGFVDIAVTATEVAFALGETVDDAVEYLADSGPGRMLLETITDDAARVRALADVRDALAPHHDGTGFRLGGGIWLTTARRASVAEATFAG